MDNADRKDHTVTRIDPQRQRIWDVVSRSPIRNLWNLQGVPPLLIARRTFDSILVDNLLSRAAELGFYFIFALFPTLVSASAILGLVARSAVHIYLRLLDYLAFVVPHDALSVVLDTFNQTAAQASGGKVTFGIAAAIWSASVGFTAIQDTLNTVYKVKETRPYWKARGQAILVTALLSIAVTMTLACLLAGTLLSHLVRHRLAMPHLALGLGIAIHLVFDALALMLVTFIFALIYYFAPDTKTKRWRWLSPGAALGIGGWIASSLILRVYLHFFDNYALTYGSLEAVIVLLTWFYLTGLMLLIGAEIDSEIEAAATERQLKDSGVISPAASTDPEHPVAAST